MTEYDNCEEHSVIFTGGGEVMKPDCPYCGAYLLSSPCCGRVEMLEARLAAVVAAGCALAESRDQWWAKSYGNRARDPLLMAWWNALSDAEREAERAAE